MTTIVLFIHIALAFVSLGYAASVIGASWKRKLEKARTRTTSMVYGTVVTTGSGILLTILTASSIGQMCTTLFLFLAVIGAVYGYQRVVFRQVVRN